MTRIRLQIQVLPWQIQGQSQENVKPNRQCEIKPWLQPEDPEASLLQLVENIARRYSRIYVGRGNLRVKELQDYWGNTLDLSDKIQDIFDDRSPTGDNLTSICKVLRYAPEPEEIFNPNRFASLLPESAARPQKRPPPPLFDDSQRPHPSVEDQSSPDRDRTNKKRKTDSHVSPHSPQPSPEHATTSQNPSRSPLVQGRQRSVLQISDSQNIRDNGVSQQADFGSPRNRPHTNGQSIPDSPAQHHQRRGLAEPIPKSESPEIGFSVVRAARPVISEASAQQDQIIAAVRSASRENGARSSQGKKSIAASAPAENGRTTQESEQPAESSSVNADGDAGHGGQQVQAKSRSNKRAGADIYDPIESDTESFQGRQQMFNGRRRSSLSKTPCRVAAPFKLSNQPDERAAAGQATSITRVATKVTEPANIAPLKAPTVAQRKNSDAEIPSTSAGRDETAKGPSVQKLKKIVIQPQLSQSVRPSVVSNRSVTGVNGQKSSVVGTLKQGSAAHIANAEKGSYTASSPAGHLSAGDDLNEADPTAQHTATAKKPHTRSHATTHVSDDEDSNDTGSIDEDCSTSGAPADPSAKDMGDIVKKPGLPGTGGEAKLSSTAGAQPDSTERELVLAMDDDEYVPSQNARISVLPQQSCSPESQANKTNRRTVNGAKRRLFSQPSFVTHDAKPSAVKREVKHSAARKRALPPSKQTQLEATPLASTSKDTKTPPTLNYNQRQALARKRKDAPVAASFRRSHFGPNGMLSAEPETPRNGGRSPSLAGSDLTSSRSLRVGPGNSRRSLTPHLPGKATRNPANVQSYSPPNESMDITRGDSLQGAVQASRVPSRTYSAAVGLTDHKDQSRPSQPAASQKAMETERTTVMPAPSSAPANQRVRSGRAVQTKLPVHRDKKLKGRAQEERPSLEPKSTEKESNPIDDETHEASSYFSEGDKGWSISRAGPSARKSRQSDRNSSTKSDEESITAANLLDPALPASQRVPQNADGTYGLTNGIDRRRSDNAEEDNINQLTETMTDGRDFDMITKPSTTSGLRSRTSPQRAGKPESKIEPANISEPDNLPPAESELNSQSEVTSAATPELEKPSGSEYEGSETDSTDSSDDDSTNIPSRQPALKARRRSVIAPQHARGVKAPELPDSPQQPSQMPAAPANADPHDSPEPTPPASSLPSSMPTVNVIHTSPSSQPARRKPYKYPTLTAMSQEAEGRHPSIITALSKSVSSTAENHNDSESGTSSDEEDGSNDGASMSEGGEGGVFKKTGAFFHGCKELVHIRDQKSAGKR